MNEEIAVQIAVFLIGNVGGFLLGRESMEKKVSMAKKFGREDGMKAMLRALGMNPKQTPSPDTRKEQA